MHPFLQSFRPGEGRNYDSSSQMMYISSFQFWCYCDLSHLDISRQNHHQHDNSISTINTINTINTKTTKTLLTTKH